MVSSTQKNKTLKTDFRLEYQLLVLESQIHQIVLSKFRISSHNLQIETWYYDNCKLKPDERLCILCDIQVHVVEDENIFY